MLVALDLGSSTGFAAKDPKSSLIIHSTWDFTPSRFDGGGMRFLRFRNKLRELHTANPITLMFFEEVRRHLGTTAAHVYGGFLAVLTSFCEDNVIPYEGVPVQTIKKFWTGKGNANKEAMIAAAREHGYELGDDEDDAADAIALLHLKAQEHGL